MTYEELERRARARVTPTRDYQTCYAVELADLARYHPAEYRSFMAGIENIQEFTTEGPVVITDEIRSAAQDYQEKFER